MAAQVRARTLCAPVTAAIIQACLRLCAKRERQERCVRACGGALLCALRCAALAATPQKTCLLSSPPWIARSQQHRFSRATPARSHGEVGGCVLLCVASGADAALRVAWPLRVAAAVRPMAQNHQYSINAIASRTLPR